MDLASAAKNSEKKVADPLDLINKEIAALEAKMSAIEHIKLYADSVNLQELSSRDIEQTVAHFLKTTRKSATAPAGVVDVSAERKASAQDKSNAKAAMVGGNKNSQTAE